MFKKNVKYGIRILKSLGFEDLTPEEEKAFKERWKKAYEHMDRNPVMATRLLYVKVIPFLDKYSEFASNLSHIREREFDKRLTEMGLSSRLN